MLVVLGANCRCPWQHGRQLDEWSISAKPQEQNNVDMQKSTVAESARVPVIKKQTILTLRR